MSRNARKLEELDQRIKTEIGIDLEQYRNDEVVDNFVSLLLFPRYVLLWMFGPLLLCIALYGLGFFFLDLVQFEYFFYTFLAGFLFLLAGIFLGLLVLSWRMQSDLEGITDYSVEIMNTAARDTQQLRSTLSGEERKQALNLLFAGVVQLVTVPTIVEAIKNKVPIFSGLLSRFARKALRAIVGRAELDERPLQIAPQESADEEPLPLIVVDEKEGGVNKILRFAFGLVRFPLKLGLVVTLIFLALLIYVLH